MCASRARKRVLSPTLCPAALRPQLVFWSLQQSTGTGAGDLRLAVMDFNTSATHPMAVPSENGTMVSTSNLDEQVQVEDHQLVPVGIGAISQWNLVAPEASPAGASHPAPTGSPTASVPEASISAAGPQREARSPAAAEVCLPASCLHPSNIPTSSSSMMAPKLPSHQPLSVQQCRITGAGLSTAIAWRETSFKVCRRCSLYFWKPMLSHACPWTFDIRS